MQGFASLRSATTAVARFQSSAMAENTGRAYQSDWVAFERWCRLHEVQPMPASPLTVAQYLAHQADLPGQSGGFLYAPNTLSRRLAAITRCHELAGIVSPCRDAEVLTTMAGIRRARRRPAKRATPLLLDELRQVLAKIELDRFPEAVIGRRDAALLVMGFAGAFRRSELVALETADISQHQQDGLHVTVRHSKTDQEGAGAMRALPFGVNPDTCPPCVYLRWRQVLDVADSLGRPGLIRLLKPSSDTDGLAHLCRDPAVLGAAAAQTASRPLFRAVHRTGVPGRDALSGQVVAAVVKRRATAAGLSAAGMSGHSLRAGFVTQAVRGGADAGAIMRQTGHKSHAMVELYRRESAPLIGNAVTILGL